MIDYTYRDFQELDFENFTYIIWNDNISEKIVSSAYYAENEDFILAYTYDVYRLFQMNTALTIRIVARMIESFFFNLFRYKGKNIDVLNSTESDI